MKRYLFIIIILATVSVHRTYAQYYSINYDTKTVAAMAAAFGTEVVAEVITMNKSLLYSNIIVQLKLLRLAFLQVSS